MIGMSEPLISLQDIHFSYRRARIWGSIVEKTVMKGISFDIFKNETLGVVGRNGAGKSTLLKVICGIYRPDIGQVVNNGASVSIISLRAGFDQSLNGYENIIMSGLYHGYRRSEMLTMLDRIVAFSELNGVLEKPVETYSNGMKAKLGFSILMGLEPDIMLLDEALSVGDIDFAKKAERAMTKKLASGKANVIVSHSLKKLQRLCTRILWIEDGEVRAIGEPDDVLGQYANSARSK